MFGFGIWFAGIPAVIMGVIHLWLVQPRFAVLWQCLITGIVGAAVSAGYDFWIISGGSLYKDSPFLIYGLLTAVFMVLLMGRLNKTRLPENTEKGNP